MRLLQIRAPTLMILLGAFFLSACSSTAPSGSASAGASSADADSTQVERLMARIETTPDSLATLPRPLFYRSASPLSTAPLPRGWTPTPIQPVKVSGWNGSNEDRTNPDSDSPSPGGEEPSARTQVEVIGGIASGRAQLGIRVHTVVPDPELLRAVPFVDLFGKQMMIRREHVWRTLRQEGDSLYEERFVPLSTSDLQRLIRADTAALAINQAHVRLPPPVQDELASLQAARPDSLFADTVDATTRLTVYHSPDSPPEFEGGLTALGKAVKYPQRAQERGLGGTVRLGFVIHPDGSTSHLQIEQSAHPLLDASAVRVAKNVDFKPVSFRGRPVPIWTTLPVVFQMK